MTLTTWCKIALLVLFATVACEQRPGRDDQQPRAEAPQQQEPRVGGPPPRLDLSSTQALGRSLQEVNASLSNEEQKRFGDAFATVTRHVLGDGAGKESSPEARQKLAQALSGKTAVEVIAEAQAIREGETAASN